MYKKSLNEKQEIWAVKSIAGEVLEPKYSTNKIGKSIAGSALKCFGDKGVPSIKMVEQAQQVIAAGNKVYSFKIIFLAKAIVQKYYRI